jgi:hypothetical protein
MLERAFAHIEQKKTKEYEQAVKILIGLRELADYQDKLEAFEARVRQIRADYARLRALQARMDGARLPDVGDA